MTAGFRGWVALGLFAGLLFGITPSSRGDVFLGTLIGVKGPSTGLGFSNASLSGSYRFRSIQLHDFEGVHREAGIAWGTTTFDGTGGCAGNYSSFNSDGGTESGPFTATYGVNSDGSFTFTLPGTSGPEFWSGTLSKDAGCNVLYMTQGEMVGGDVRQSLLIAVKHPASTPTLASLNGTYSFRNLGLDNIGGSEPDATVNTGTLVVDGAGNWSAAITDFDGDGSTGSRTATGTYRVNDGSFDFMESGSPDVLFTAELSGDANMLVLSDAREEHGEVLQWIGTAVKQSPGTSFTNATLSGTYRVGMVLLDNPLRDYREAYIVNTSVTFDGAGSYTSAFGAFDSSGSPSSGTGSGTYSVNPDGSFTVTQTNLNPDESYTGHISAGAEVIVLSRAEAFVGGGGFLVLDLGPWGIYGYDGGDLQYLTSADPLVMTAIEGGVALAFEGYGVYTYDGGAWTHITTVTPEAMVAWGSLLVMDFGMYGVYSYDGASWNRIHYVSPEAMVTWGSLLVLDYGLYGLYSYDGSTWRAIHSVSPEAMVAWGDLLVLDYGPYGVYSYGSTGWDAISAVSPETMSAWGSLLVMDFGDSGVYYWDGAGWTPVTTEDPEAILPWGDYLIMDFGAGGLYAYDLVTWTPITAADAEGMIVVDF